MTEKKQPYGEINQSIGVKNQLIKDNNVTSSVHPHRLPFLLIVCSTIIFFLGKSLFETYQQGTSYHEDYLQAQSNNQQAVEQNRIIQEEFQRVNDPNYLAEIARRDYYYSKEGEIIFILPNDTKE